MKVKITIDKERFNVALKQIGMEELTRIKNEYETLTKSLLSTRGVQKNQIIDFGHVEPSSVQASYEEYRQRLERRSYLGYRYDFAGYGVCHPHRDRHPFTGYNNDFDSKDYDSAEQYVQMKEVTCPLEDEERYSIELPQYTMPIPEETSVKG